jgi:hypothetical protein
MSEPPLPGLLDEIAAIAGRERALALAAARGGTRFTVPKAVRTDHWLVDLIGLEAAQHLAAGRGGELILVPIGPAARAATTRHLIRSALAAGYSIETTARLANVHARTVYRHKRRLQPVAEARAG